MNYKKGLQKLGKWIEIVQKSILVLSAIEVLIVIIIGVASSNVYNAKYSTFWISVLLILSILYLVLTIIKIAYNKAFPSSIVEELQSKRELEFTKASINRKDALNSYISSTIIALSTCECNLPPRDPDIDWRLDSDEDFQKGMESLTKTFNNVLNIILDTTNIQFTTGIYIKNFRGVNQENEPVPNEGTFLLRDDFNLNESDSIRNIMSNNNISGVGLEMQNGIKSSLNNGIYLTHTFKNKKDKDILMVCSNIEELKDSNNQRGVLFILTKKIKDLPKDLESVLRMFTNIISHWIDLYDHEVKSRQLDFIIDKNEEEIKEDDSDSENDHTEEASEQ